MSAKFEAREQKNGTVYVYEDGLFIGAVNLSEFPLAAFARVMRAANEATHFRAVAEAAGPVVDNMADPNFWDDDEEIAIPAGLIKKLAAALDAGEG